LKKRVVLLAVGALVLIVALTTYVGVRAGRELMAARDALTGTPTNLDGASLESARGHLRRARSTLESLPGRVARAVPLTGSNLNAMKAAASGLDPALAAASELQQALEPLSDQGVVDQGRIDAGLLASLRAPLGRQVRALETLEDELDDARSGALLPPVWDGLEKAGERASELAAAARKLEGVLGVSDALLGEDRPRTYLMMLVNNAELRGAGGILSGVGTVHVSDGRLQLGRFSSVHALRTKPLRSVPAPPDYERRFARFKANTTLWLNTTWSPDVPDAALVAARLYRMQTGTGAEGAIIVDPRGLQSLLPPDAELAVPGTEVTVRAGRLARFVYSDAYERFDDQRLRRDALVALGAVVMDRVLQRSFSGLPALRTVGKAAAGGHLRVVSFDEAEADALAAAGLSGELPPGRSDSALVVAHNLGSGDHGTKLDYWADRYVGHACEVRDDGTAGCTTEVTIRNVAPTGLTTYVAGRPSGTLRDFVEVYLPASSNVLSVVIDGEPEDFSDERQGELRAVGVPVSIPRTGHATISVGYELRPRGSGLTVSLIPQPLARDATAEVALDLPSGWTATGPGSMDGRTWRYTGSLDAPLTIEAGPDDRTGLPALWKALVRFWNEPIL
jgi:Protein of unknown function (DUF4012)